MDNKLIGNENNIPVSKYGIEVYEDSCHVTMNGKEAVLNESDSNYLIGIIDIYMKDAM